MHVAAYIEQHPGSTQTIKQHLAAIKMLFDYLVVSQVVPVAIIASGLGDHISLVGLSGGAVAAAWMAQNREGIGSVVLVSPFFGFHGKPVALINGISAILTRAPNFYLWWNDKEKEAIAGPCLSTIWYALHGQYHRTFPRRPRPSCLTPTSRQSYGDTYLRLRHGRQQ